MSTMPTEEEIRNTLRRLGVKTSNRGYSYISYGISLTLQDKSYLEYVTKGLYVDIARNFNTSGSCVERDIRTTVKAIWETEDTDLLMEICNGTTPKRPPNKKFFAMMHDYFTRVPKVSNDMSCQELHADFFCDDLGKQCPKFKDLCEELTRLREENRRLTAILSDNNLL